MTSQLRADGFNRKVFFRTVFTLAFPIALQNLLTTTASMVDTIMIGTQGELAVAAVGICSQISSLFFSVYFGLICGALLYFAQYWGAGDHDGINRTFGLSLIALMVVALGFVFRHFSNKLFDKNDDSVDGLNQSNGVSLTEQASTYLKVPKDAKTLEILNITFKQKGDKVRLVNEEEDISTDTTIFDAYIENDCLNLVELKKKYAIPIDTITGYSEVKRKTTVWWLEEEDPDKEFLKKYNLKILGGNIVCKYVYSINITKDGEEYCFYLTPYEFEKAKEFIGKELELQ